jgi:microcystin-dependent protein
MPAHTHGHDAATSVEGEHTHDQPAREGGASGGSGDEMFNQDRSPTPQTSSDGAHSHSSGITNTGGGQAFDNNPPYQVVAFIMKE